MSKISTEITESGCNSIPNQEETSRTLPDFLLGATKKVSGLTSQDKNLLSILFYSSDAESFCCLSNQEIAERLNCKEQSIQKRLQRLEKLTYLKRYGNHRSRKILLFESSNYLHNLEYDLTIPKEIWNHKNLSVPQKSIIAAILKFDKVKPKNWTWYAWKLGMNIQAYKLNLRKIILNHHPEPHKVLYGNPIRFYKQPHKVLYALFGGDGEASGVLSKDNTKGASHPTTFHHPDSSEGDKEMNQPGITSIRPRNIHSDPYAKLTSSPSKTYSTEPSPEIEGIWKSFPNNAKHQPSKKAYQLAKDTISQLRRSPRVGLSPGQVEKLTNRMLKDPWNKFTRKQIDDFLDHKFSPEDRKLIYSNLSKLHDKAYGGFKGTASLSDALCNINGYSEIMLVWYYPPKPKRAPLVNVNHNLENVVDMVMEVVKDQSYATMNKVRSVVKNLHMIYEKETRPRMTDETKYHYGDFKRFMIGFIDFVVEKYGSELYPGHFRSGSNSKSIFQQWIYEMKNKTNAPMETSDYLTALQQEL